jgi:uncharacterized protein YndB with AHSA1/START domain
MSLMTGRDRIEKKIVLRAPRSAVWRALADAKAFGEWFGVALDGDITPGARVRGRLKHKGFEHVPFEITVETMKPEELLSWRWHPDAPVEPEHDFATEPTTLVTFTLDEVADGTVLTVVESGFDRIAPSRRTAAYRGNEEGWASQMEAIERYVKASR